MKGVEKWEGKKDEHRGEGESALERERGGRHANANVNVEERRYGKCGYVECMAAN